MKKIDLGCGNSKKEGFLGVDLLPLEGVDVIHNLSVFPYPFLDSEIDEIWMDNVLEHLINPLKVVEELYRISKKGSQITIAVPYFRSMYSVIDPTHVNFFSVMWFSYFDPSHKFNKKYMYSYAKFTVLKIEFDREWKERKVFNPFKALLVSFANRFPIKYELYLSHLFPLNSLTFTLSPVK